MFEFWPFLWVLLWCIILKKASKIPHKKHNLINDSFTSSKLFRKSKELREISRNFKKETLLIKITQNGEHYRCKFDHYWGYSMAPIVFKPQNDVITLEKLWQFLFKNTQNVWVCEDWVLTLLWVLPALYSQKSSKIPNNKHNFIKWEIKIF